MFELSALRKSLSSWWSEVWCCGFLEVYVFFTICWALPFPRLSKRLMWNFTCVAKRFVRQVRIYIYICFQLGVGVPYQINKSGSHDYMWKISLTAIKGSLPLPVNAMKHCVLTCFSSFFKRNDIELNQHRNWTPISVTAECHLLIFRLLIPSPRCSKCHAVLTKNKPREVKQILLILSIKVKSLCSFLI